MLLTGKKVDHEPHDEFGEPRRKEFEDEERFNGAAEEFYLSLKMNE